MQNLPIHLRQKDKSAYQAITTAGSEHYEKLYMSGEATRDNSDAFMGIPADDFNIFATMIYAFHDHQAAFTAIHTAGDTVRHIDAGSGPNLYMFIASLPYADEFIAIDVTPANIDRLLAIKNGSARIAAHWQAWLEIAVILYDIGSAKKLVALDHEHPDIYDQLRHWPTLIATEKKDVRHRLRTQCAVVSARSNPYRHINLQSTLPQKLQPRVGDIIDNVEPLRSLAGTADIYTRIFFSESIDDRLEIVAHAETNSIQFAKTGAISISGHMSKTTGYKGFFTPDELAVDKDKKLVELPATHRFFETVIGEIVDLSDDYRMLWQDLSDVSEDRKMVRQGQLYGGAVILYGIVNHKKADGTNKFDNGPSLIQKLKNIVQITTNTGQTIHCIATEASDVAHELVA